MPRPVSPEVLSLFREGFDCWNRDELDEMTRMYADDAVFDVSAVFADVEPKRGRGEVHGYWTELRETWAGIRQEPIEAFDLGRGQFVVDLRLSGTGSQSGAEVKQRLAMLDVIRPEDRRWSPRALSRTSPRPSLPLVPSARSSGRSRPGGPDLTLT